MTRIEHRDIFHYDLPETWKMDDSADEIVIYNTNPNSQGAIVMSVYFFIDRSTFGIKSSIEAVQSFAKKGNITYCRDTQIFYRANDIVTYYNNGVDSQGMICHLWLVEKFPHRIAISYHAKCDTSETVQAQSIVEGIEFYEMKYYKVPESWGKVYLADNLSISIPSTWSISDFDEEGYRIVRRKNPKGIMTAQFHSSSSENMNNISIETLFREDEKRLGNRFAHYEDNGLSTKYINRTGQQLRNDGVLIRVSYILFRNGYLRLEYKGSNDPRYVSVLRQIVMSPCISE